MRATKILAFVVVLAVLITANWTADTRSQMELANLNSPMYPAASFNRFPVVITLDNVTVTQCGVTWTEAGVDLTLHSVEYDDGEPVCWFETYADGMVLAPAALEVDFRDLSLALGPLQWAEIDVEGCHHLDAALYTGGGVLAYWASRAYCSYSQTLVLRSGGLDAERLLLHGSEYYVTEIRLYVDTEVRIKQISAQGIGTPGNNPETGKKVRLEADIEVPPGFEVTKCAWTGSTWPLLLAGDPAQNCRGEYMPPTGPGPNFFTYGKKHVMLVVNYRHIASGITGQVFKKHEYKVFFEKTGNDNEGKANDKGPNWFEYWGDDGAVPQLNATDIIYDATKGARSYGSWSGHDGKIRLGGAAAMTHYTPKITLPKTAKCPGGTFGGAKGIDSLAEVIVHERKHEALRENWNKNGTWPITTTVDSDDPTPDVKGDMKGDNLPDTYENNTTKTDPNNLDSCDLEHKKKGVYKWYGDEEFVAMQASEGQKGKADKDWANPGKQTTPPFTLAVPLQAQETKLSVKSGPAGPNAPYSGFVHPAEADIGELTGNYSDVGVDLDGDSLYDSLKLSVEVQVVEPALYNVVAWLADGSGTEIAWASTQETLEAGTHTVDLFFDGRLIRDSGLNGPYNIARVELRIEDEERLVDAADNAHTTAAYQHTDFAPPVVAFTDSFSDTGVDTDGDSMYDLLRVNVGLDVQQPGTYTIVGELESSSGALAVGEKTVALSSGSQQVELDFDGQLIFLQRQDGPYHLRKLRVEDESGNRIDFVYDAHQTHAYNYTEFQHHGTTIDTASYSDQGLDSDGDGDYDSLRVTFEIEADQAWAGQLLASLTDEAGQPIADAVQDLRLMAGTNTVALDFPGSVIRTHAVDGPYHVTAMTLMATDGTVVDYQPLAHTTAAYRYTDFAKWCFDLLTPANVGLEDIQAMAQRWRLAAGPPYDADGSGMVTVADIMQAVVQWGESCTEVTPTPTPTPTPTTTPPGDGMSAQDAPGARWEHTAVWTGDAMIVWGGTGANGDPLATGGRYDPATDSWVPVSNVYAPSARSGHTAVWTGTEMIVWGGTGTNGHPLDTGGRYNPTTGRWTPVATDSAPSARSGHTAVWTGTEMIVWGGWGVGGSALNSGGRYDPNTDTWTPTASDNAPSGRSGHTAVWTGTEMIIWGGGSGGCYDPAVDLWASMSASVNTASVGHAAIWTGTEMIVWGGRCIVPAPGICLTRYSRYDPATDSWTPITTANDPPGRRGHTLVWAGAEMIAWGGRDADENAVHSGGRYDPGADRWTSVSTLKAPRARSDHTTVWTGTEMMVWGGRDANDELLKTGGRYDLSADAWRDCSDGDACTPVTPPPDESPPYLINVTPEAGGIASQVTAISANFSEPIDLSTLTSVTFQLFTAGPDGIAGNADDVPVTGGTLSYDNNTNTASLSFSSALPADLYRAVVAPPLADLAGNPLAAEFTWTFEIAPFLQFGAVISGSIDFAGDTDTYFLSGTAGDQVLVRIAATSGDLNPSVQVNRPDGTFLCSSSTTGSFIEVECPLGTSGTYTIFVGGDETDTGTYILYLRRLNNPVNATPIAFGEILSGTIDPAIEMDAYTFSGTASDQILVRMVDTSDTFSSEVGVYRPDGTRLCFDSESLGLAEAECSLDTSGTHTILVADSGGNDTGTYTLYLRRPNNPVNAIPIAFGDILSGTIDPAIELDAYTFDGTAGDQVFVRMTATSGDIDPQFEVYAPDGTQLCSDSGYGSTPAEAECSLDSDGTYAILGGDRGGNDTGTYTLELQQSNNLANATPVTFGDTLPDTICKTKVFRRSTPPTAGRV